MMKFFSRLVVGILLWGYGSFAHPGSGIFLDRQGNIYFIDTGSGLWKIDKEGKLTRLQAPAYHWIAIDLDGHLKNATLPNFSSGDAIVARSASNPNILLSSDFPITVGPDGSLYYPRVGDNEQLQIFRLAPSGNTTTLKTLPPKTDNEPRKWVNGIVATADGSVYYAEDNAIRRITPKGTLTTVADNVKLSGCDSVPGVEAEVGPYLRGLDVDTQGTVYVAAAGCRAVLKITADKKVTTVLRTPGPWSPTAVAISGSDLYVLEYLHTEGDNRREWLPRVRKVSSDGHVVTVATIDRR